MSTQLPRYWRNETGIVHLVSDWHDDVADPFNAAITTGCGLEYMVASPGYTFDPEKPMHQQTNHPLSTGRLCKRCRWEEVFDHV